MIKLRDITNEPKYKLLIAHLKEKEMTCNDILLLFNVPNTHSNRVSISNMLMTLGNHVPIYEPIPAHYKILTDKDLEEYQELYRQQKKMREDRKKNG